MPESKYIDKIAVPEIKEFTEKALEEYNASAEKIQEADQVAEILLGLLKKKKLITDNSHQSYVDVLISACLLHNLFYDPEDWTSLFWARRELTPLAAECGMNSQFRDAIFQTIESQLGEDTPVPNCKPVANSPTELFSYAIWFAKEHETS